MFKDTLFGENIVTAWDIETVKRDIRVGVIDNITIDFLHEDFGGGLGYDKCIVGGEQLIKESDGSISVHKPDTNYVSVQSHSTEIAGFIGAKTGNEIGVAGIAGGWDDTLGVSIYSMCGNDATTNSYSLHTKAIIDAVSRTSAPSDTFRVNLLNCSISQFSYSEEMRRALDYAYRLGVVTCAIKSNLDENDPVFPGDYDYNKVICTTGYGAYHDSGDVNKSLIPTRKIPGHKGGGFGCDNSNYGYGLDIMGFSDYCWNPALISNQTTKGFRDGGGYGNMDGSSASAPQVAGVAALILSYFSHIDHSRFHNYENGRDTLITYLSPEDVEGLLCISALDCKYDYILDSMRYDEEKSKWVKDTVYLKDTIGYDASTGYGILKGGETMEKLLEPYELNHYTEIGGTVVDTAVIDTFIVVAPYQDLPLLLPTDSLDLAKYKADRYKVQKTVYFSGWEIACSWGRGGDGTFGWSGSVPLDPGANKIPFTGTGVYPVGYCRVIGDTMPGFVDFNYNNIRDISYWHDTITLETFCYMVYERPNVGLPYLPKGIYPCEPDSVIYRYSIWGEKTPVGVDEKENEVNINSLKCEVRTILGEQRIYIYYSMEYSGPVEISIYNNIGDLVYSINKNNWTDNGRNIHSVSLRNFASGAYHIAIIGGRSVSRCSFNYAR